MLARIPLVSVVLIISFVSLIVTVLMFLGAPMAGGWSALVAAGLAGAMTVLMALAFSHHEKVDPGQ